MNLCDSTIVGAMRGILWRYFGGFCTHLTIGEGRRGILWGYLFGYQNHTYRQLGGIMGAYFGAVLHHFDNCGGNGGFSKRTKWHILAARIWAIFLYQMINWAIIIFGHHHQLIF